MILVKNLRFELSRLLESQEKDVAVDRATMYQWIAVLDVEVDESEEFLC